MGWRILEYTSLQNQDRYVIEHLNEKFRNYLREVSKSHSRSIGSINVLVFCQAFAVA